MTEFKLTKKDLRFIEEEIAAKGFYPYEIGHYKVDSKVKIYKPQKLYKRSCNLDVYRSNLDEKGLKNFGVGGKTPKSKNQETLEYQRNKIGVKDPYGNPKGGFDPLSSSTAGATILGTAGTDSFSQLPSLKAIRSEKESLVVAFDSEWIDCEPRYILSWQFAVVWEDILYEYIFLNYQNRLLKIEDCLQLILRDLGYKAFDSSKYQEQRACIGFSDSGSPLWKTFSNQKELTASSKDVHPLFEDPTTGKFVPVSYTIEEGHNLGLINKFQKGFEEIFDPETGKFVPDYTKPLREWRWSYPDPQYPTYYDITLLCHFGRVDISTLENSQSLLKVCSEVQGGLVSLDFPKKIYAKSRAKGLCSDKYIYPIRLTFRDTMCQTPSSGKSLAVLGDTVGIPKLKDDLIDKNHMDKTLLNHPDLFFEYSSRDSVVTLLYAASLYGYNRQIAVTLTSVTAKVMRDSMMTYLGCKSTEEFDRVYRGLTKVTKGKVKSSTSPAFLVATAKEAITPGIEQAQLFASHSYHGGYNACFKIGWIDRYSWDYDLQNAYPTAMVMVPDIDWDNPVKFKVERQELDLSYWSSPTGGFNPMVPFFGFINFEFPEDCKFPCIPVNVEGRLVFPRTSEGLAGVYVSGPEVYLALKMGAKVFCETGLFLKPRLLEDGSESRSLANAVKQLVSDRALAKKLFGKKSLEQEILKVMVNSGYGKNAQNVVDKRSWDAYSQQMQEIGCSMITNPISASLITSFVRAELLATLHEIDKLGFESFSVTTDGFISTIPEEKLVSLDMMGLKPLVEKSRLFLTDGEDPSIWEAKHEQDSFLNLTTRGNISLNIGNPSKGLKAGVCAHNSVKTPYESDSFEDRLWMIDKCLTREGPVRYTKPSFVGFKELVLGETFKVVDVERGVHQDFDLKRKPVRESFETIEPLIEGRKYVTENFDTIPYETVEEFKFYKSRGELCEALRTKEHWDKFWLRIDYPGKPIRAKDGIEWTKLKSCVMGHLAGLWSIPNLDDNSLTVAEKIYWLNSLDLSKKQFKKSDWKNCRRPERQVNMLAREDIQDFLDIMGAVDFEI